MQPGIWTLPRRRQSIRPRRSRQVVPPTSGRRSPHLPVRAGMSELANDADVTRQRLYKALSENGDPRPSTLLGVICSLGVRLSIQPDG